MPSVDIYKADFRPHEAHALRPHEKTLMKLVVERASQRVLGAHMVGPDAPEIIQAHGDRREAGRHQGRSSTHGGHPPDARPRSS